MPTLMIVHKQSRMAALVLACLALLAGCGGDDAGASPEASTEAAAATDSVRDTATAAPAAKAPTADAPEQIRGIYLNAYAAGSKTRLPKLLKIADETEINTFVVDVKTERGIHYTSQVPLATELQAKGENTLRDLKAFVDSLHAHNIYAMARIVVFKDPILSKAKPAWSIQKPGGGLWVDKAGNTWVSAWDKEVWDYNLDIAEEAAKAGFDEIQFDYVRFPEPYKSLPAQVHPEAQGDRTDAIAAFLNEAKRRLHPHGAVVAADIFGLSPNDPRDVGIGQQWETIVSTADHVLPMMYPSHYLPTHLPGVKKPDLMPYETLYRSAGMARIRSDKLREVGVQPARVIPWIQGFTATWLKNHLDYGGDALQKQKQGIYDVGYEDWVIWHPGSKYEHLLGGLEKDTQGRAKPSYNPPADIASAVNLFEKQGVAEARQKAAQQARGDTTDPAAAQAAKTGKEETE